MDALNGLNSASVLLQQIANRVAPVAPKPDAKVSSAQTVLETSFSNGSAEKSASSAIFNAVTSLSEKQEKSVEAVLDYIDRTYTKFEERWANSIKMLGDDANFQDHIVKAKKIGENLKQLVLADPEGIHRVLEQIKSGRPDISQEHAIGLMIAELGNPEGRRSVSGD